MDDARFGRLIRLLRQRRGWRQVDLAARSRVGISVVARIEAGRLGPMRIGTLREVTSAFGLSFDPALRGLGADLDRLLDEKHAVLLGTCSNWLARTGWLLSAEVSYSEYGERGSIDLLAWHEAHRSLLVIEVKTELASLEATLRKLDEKTRLARTIGRRQGWDAEFVGRLLVLPEDRTQRRQVDRHRPILDLAFPLRGRAVQAWCRGPTGPMSGLIFLRLPANAGEPGRRRTRVRAASSPNPSAIKA